MANKNSLKIVDKTSGVISPAGYAAVVENIILNQDGLDDFQGTSNDFTAERTRKLIGHAATNAQGRATNAEIKQLDPNHEREAITPDNCRIRAQKDKRRSGNGHSKVTVPLPEQALSVAELDYIDEYLRKFMEVYNPDAPFPDPKTPESARQARKYMLGVFMLTKCR